jgi:hypothetical protein
MRAGAPSREDRLRLALRTAPWGADRTVTKVGVRGFAPPSRLRAAAGARGKK